MLTLGLFVVLVNSWNQGSVTIMPVRISGNVKRGIGSYFLTLRTLLHWIRPFRDITRHNGGSKVEFECCIEFVIDIVSHSRDR